MKTLYYLALTIIATAAASIIALALLTLGGVLTITSGIIRVLARLGYRCLDSAERNDRLALGEV